MRSLISKKPFIREVKLSKNGLNFSSRALLDTGNTLEAAIHENLLPHLKKLRATLNRHKNPLTLCGYNSKAAETTNQTVQLDIVIDGYRIPTNFVVCNAGKNEIILGDPWFTKNDVLLDCKRRKLVWPDKTLVNVKKDLKLPRQDRKESQEQSAAHQADADRRDEYMDQEYARRDLQRETNNNVVAINKLTARNKHLREVKKGQDQYQPKKTWIQDYQTNLRKMDQALLNELVQTKPSQPQLKPKPQAKNFKVEFAQVGIADCHFVSATPFGRAITHDKKNVIVTDLAEIDARIKDLESGDDSLDQDPEELRKLIAEKLPEPLSGLGPAFSKVKSDQLPPKRPGIDHEITLQGENPLKVAPLYGMSLEQLRVAKEYIEDNLKKGFIKPSKAPFSSPILMAKKPGGGLRFCVDYRGLNAVTRKDRYPIPLIKETFQRLSKAKLFTKLDVRQAFHRVRLTEESEELTSFRTRYGQFQYTVLPFGLCNGPSTFQRFINQVLRDEIDSICQVYIDDILIYSEDPLEHWAHVRTVIEKLQVAGLQIDIKKSEFGVTETKFLGYVVTTEGFRPDPEKVAIVRDWEEPTTKTQVLSFLGFCNFYRSFLKNFGRVVRPLTLLTRKDGWHPFTETEREAFSKAKELLLGDNLIAHYDPTLPTRIETDASDFVAAGVYYQLHGNKWRPVSFFSKTLNPAELNYEIHDKEMLAVILALANWDEMLIGVQEPFLIITDHRALEYFSTKRLLSARQARWTDILARYHFKITYRPGTENIIADTLTRKQEVLKTQKEKQIASRTLTLLDPEVVVAPMEPIPETDPDLNPAETQDPNQIANQEQNQAESSEPRTFSDPQLIKDVLDANKTHDSLQEYRDRAASEDSPCSLLDNQVTYHNRLIVPEVDNLRARLIHAAHVTPATAHPGQKKTYEMIKQYYYWPRMKQDCKDYVANCHTCRRIHIPRDKTPGLLQPLPIPTTIMQHVSMDFKSFPKDKHGYDNCFVVVDRLSKLSFSIPCKKTVTAKDAAQLYYEHIYRTHGTPLSITSDRGPQFISDFLAEICLLTGISHKLASPYHAPTNGNTEVFNQYLDQRLRPFVNHFQDNWSELLPSMDHAQSVLNHESIGMSPYELLHGCKPAIFFDWKLRTKQASTALEKINREEAQTWLKSKEEALNWAVENLARAQDAQMVQANKHRRPVDFTVGDKVYVTRKHWTTTRPSVKLDDQNAGPFEIIKRVGNSFKLDLPHTVRLVNQFSPDRLRKAANNPLPGQPQESRPQIEINGEPEYFVDHILESRVYRRKLQYKADWEGWPPDPTFYDASSFKHSAQKLRQFHQAYPEAPGPPVNLPAWLTAQENDEEPLDHEDDNKPVHTGRNQRIRRT